jgi:hypothetical protein
MLVLLGIICTDYGALSNIFSVVAHCSSLFPIAYSLSPMACFSFFPSPYVARVPRWRGCRGWSLVARCSSTLRNGWKPFPTTASLLVSPSGGGRGWLLVCPAERLKTVPYNRHYIHACNAGCSPLLGLLRCRDCSPNSPKRKVARSGTAPYNLIARVPRWRGQGEVTRCSLLVHPPERLETVPYSRYYMLAM